MKWKEELAAHIDEEANDHEGYMKIAEMAEKEGCCHEAGVLRDIANEELSHHHLIAEILEMENPHD